jgi:DNA (cytosine-5)-methyltransferase 1
VTERPILLDLFCGAGGAAAGYARAGFEVIGVDIVPQPRFPFEFLLSDWSDPLTILPGLWEDDGRPFAIHASPPCQRYSRGTKVHGRGVIDGHPDLVDEVREFLDAVGAPYVLENVPGSPLTNTVTLCGSSFGLGVRRHRLFEVSPEPPLLVPPCVHGDAPVPVYGHTGAGANRGRERDRGRLNGVAEWRDAMGIGWMTRDELAEAIPPAYTAFLGEHLLALLDGSWTPVPQDVFAGRTRFGAYRLVASW